MTETRRLYSFAQHKYNNSMKNVHFYERGAISGAAVTAILLGIFMALFAGLSLWLFLLYNEQKTDVDGKVALAVSEAKKKQADDDEARFAEREKEPRREFVGPDDYGRVTFMYPKTWSTYVDSVSGNTGDFEAYLNPGVVPAVSSNQPFALRILIQDTDYDKTLSKYDSLVRSGKLKSSSVTVDGQPGTRLDGEFTKDIRGSVVSFKVRDKTLSIFTDITTSDIKSEYDKIIKTVKFNT